MHKILIPHCVKVAFKNLWQFLELQCCLKKTSKTEGNNNWNEYGTYEK